MKGLPLYDCVFSTKGDFTIQKDDIVKVRIVLRGESHVFYGVVLEPHFTLLDDFDQFMLEEDVCRTLPYDPVTGKEPDWWIGGSYKQAFSTEQRSHVYPNRFVNKLLEEVDGNFRELIQTQRIGQRRIIGYDVRLCDWSPVIFKAADVTERYLPKLSNFVVDEKIYSLFIPSSDSNIMHAEASVFASDNVIPANSAKWVTPVKTFDPKSYSSRKWIKIDETVYNI